MKIDNRDFTPEIFTVGHITLATMLVELEKCPICATMMVARPLRRASPFPVWFVVDFDAQIKGAGWGIISRVRDETGHPICEDCRRDGKAQFKCALCKMVREAREVYKSYGDPAEHLCRTCYTTATVEKWDIADRELQATHRYDFD